MKEEPISEVGIRIKAREVNDNEDGTFTVVVPAIGRASISLAYSRAIAIRSCVITKRAMKSDLWIITSHFAPHLDRIESEVSYVQEVWDNSAKLV